MRLAFPRLHVNQSELAALIEWYESKLDMRVVRDEKTAEGQQVVALGYPQNPLSAEVEFRSNGSDKQYVHRAASDVYWKIGLSLADVDTARAQLVRMDVPIGTPQQFRDIGYLVNFKDEVCGYSLELLQQSFDKNFRSEDVVLDPTLPLGQQVHAVGQITLRCADVTKSIEYYREVFGMKLLSRQCVEGLFDLYFLGCTDEELPLSADGNPPDINAVEIREWLWRRPYTTLELQYFPQKPDAKFTSVDPQRENGFSAMAFTASSAEFERLQSLPGMSDVSKEHPEYKTKVLESLDPDGTRIQVLLQ